MPNIQLVVSSKPKSIFNVRSRSVVPSKTQGGERKSDTLGGFSAHAGFVKGETDFLETEDTSFPKTAMRTNDNFAITPLV